MRYQILTTLQQFTDSHENVPDGIGNGGLLQLAVFSYVTERLGTEQYRGWEKDTVFPHVPTVVDQLINKLVLEVVNSVLFLTFLDNYEYGKFTSRNPAGCVAELTKVAKSGDVELSPLSYALEHISYVSGGSVKSPPAFFWYGTGRLGAGAYDWYKNRLGCPLCEQIPSNRGLSDVFTAWEVDTERSRFKDKEKVAYTVLSKYRETLISNIQKQVGRILELMAEAR